MTQISKYLKEINSYCNFNIEFDTTNGRYKFNDIYTDEINCEYFQNQIEHLENSFVDILESIKKPNEFIKEVIDILVKFPYWYDKEEIFKFSSFNKLSKFIIVTKNNNKTKVKYRLDSILKYPEDLSSHTNLDDMEFYLISNKSLTNNYEDVNDFEKIKLEYVLTKFYYSIKEFLDYLLQFEFAMNKYGVEHFNALRRLKRPTPRIIFNSNKVDLATFFDALFRNGLMQFDLASNVSKEKALREFLDKNFSTVDRRGNITPVNNIVKDFGSLTKGHNKARQERIIDSLIDTLKVIRSELK